MADPLNPGADLAKVYGDEAKCPTCGAFAKSQPDREHRWVCGVCGAPRVDLPGQPLPEETLVALREAHGAQQAASWQRMVAWGLGVPAGFILILAIMLAPASFIASGVMIAVGVVMAILSARASGRGATERKRLRGAVERAWEAAILHLAGQNKTPAEIAAALRIAEGDVEATLATRIPVRVAVDHDPARIATPEPQEDEQEEASRHPGESVTTK